MAAIRLDDGSGGCPPTATPPADYINPFRFDDAGRLWILDPLQFRYFGAARHDIGSQSGAIGDSSLAVSSNPDIISGDSVTQGSAPNLLITNDTPKNMGVLLSHDIVVDMVTRQMNMVHIVASARWNGAHHSSARVSSIQTDLPSAYVRSWYNASSNPHDLGVEVPPQPNTPSLILAPGASATVGCKLFIWYAVGAPDLSELIFLASSAVRAYGYTLA